MAKYSLFHNQWILLFGIVALFSGGASLFDLITGRFNAASVTRPVNAINPVVPTPTSPKLAALSPPVSTTGDQREISPTSPIPTASASPQSESTAVASASPVASPGGLLKPKIAGHWVVDAAGSPDADSREIAPAIANASDGDEITLKPGDYHGEINVNRAITIHGVFDSDQPEARRPSIIGSTRLALQITGTKVTIENVSFIEDAAQKVPALAVVQDGVLELKNCEVATHSLFGAYLAKNGVLKAKECRFQSFGAGCGLALFDTAQAEVTDSKFVNNCWGTQSLNSSHLTLVNCTFTRCGQSTGYGCVATVRGQQAVMILDRCQIEENSGVVACHDESSLTVRDCTFRANGITEQTVKELGGCVAVRTQSRAEVTNCVFENNREGITVQTGGKLVITKCKLSGNGQAFTQSLLGPFGANLYVTDTGSEAKVSDTTFENPITWGLFVTDQGHLSVQNSFVRGGLTAVLAGDVQKPGFVTLQNVEFTGQTRRTQVIFQEGSEAELTKCRFIQAASEVNAIEFIRGSHGTVRECEIRDGGGSGLEVTDPNTDVAMLKTQISRLKNAAILCGEDGRLNASDCVLKECKIGIQVGNPPEPELGGTATLERCVIQLSGLTGVNALGRTTLTLRGVTFRNNSRDIMQTPPANVIQEK